MEEEEPEGETVVGPSGEATAHSSGNTPHIPFISPVINSYMYIFFNISLPLFNLFFFLADESADEEVPRHQTKKEEDIDMLHSWMQVGGLLPNLRERHGGSCWR